jgi:hypothetical protein
VLTAVYVDVDRSVVTTVAVDTSVYDSVFTVVEKMYVVGVTDTYTVVVVIGVASVTVVGTALRQEQALE